MYERKYPESDELMLVNIFVEFGVSMHSICPPPDVKKRRKVTKCMQKLQSFVFFS